MLKKKIKVYISHYIRGPEGNAASKKTIDTNIAKTKAVCQQLRIRFGSNLDLYVPAEMDEFPRIALELGLLNVEQVLDIDCVIVSRCDALIFLDFEHCLSEGMKREGKTALACGTSIYSLDGMDEVNLELLRVWLETL